MITGNLRRSCVPVLMALLSALTWAGSATAQTFPSRPITMIVPFPAGGAVDVQARFLAQSASKELGQAVVIVNRAGASGSLGPLAVRTAAPDGYTLTMFGGNLFRLQHMQKVGYDSLKDFTYIIRLVDFGFGITVAPDAPWKTLADLLAHARANPGIVTVGAIGPGAAGHVAITQLGKLAGVQLNYIPSNGAIESQQAVIGRQIDFAADTAFAPLVSAGTLRLLAVMNEARNPGFASVPTLKDLGFDVVATSSVGVVGPSGMDPQVAKTIHDAFYKALRDPEFAKLVEQQALAVRYLGSAAYTEFAAQQVAKEKLIVTELLGGGK